MEGELAADSFTLYHNQATNPKPDFTSQKCIDSRASTYFHTSQRKAGSFERHFGGIVISGDTSADFIQFPLLIQVSIPTPFCIWEVPTTDATVDNVPATQ